MRKILLSIAPCIALNINAQTTDFTETDHVKELYDSNINETVNVNYETINANKNVYYLNTSAAGNSYKHPIKPPSVSFNYPSSFSTNNESEYYSPEVITIICSGIGFTLLLGLVILRFWE